jgi:hypothetical protein
VTPGGAAAGSVQPMSERREPDARAEQPTTGLLAASDARVAAGPGPSPPPRNRFATGPLRGLRRGVPKGFGEALWLFVTMRVVFSLFALMASVLFQLPAPCTWEGGPLVNATGLSFRLLGVWQRWDACWYEKIAAVGYQPNDSAVAFFPLYPLLMRAAGAPLAGNLTLGGMIVSGVAYIAAMTGLYRLTLGDFDEQAAQRAVLYVSVFPAAFFLFAPFSEALFLALAVWALYLARRGAWGRAAMIALLAGLARTQGALLALPLAWEVVCQWRAGRRRLAGALVSLLPPCGFLLFLAYSKVFAGWTTFQAQQAWGLAARTPWAAAALSWQHIRQRGDAIEALNLALLGLFVIILIIGLRELPLSYTLYAAPQLLLIGTRQNFFSPLMATSRYVLVLFPAFVVLALLLQHRRLHYSWLILSLLLLALLLYAFLSGPFVA